MPNIVQITVKTKAEDLLRFMLFHAFSKPSGLLTLSASIVSLICLPFSVLLWKDQFVSLALALLVFIYLILTPLNMYSQSRRQVSTNPVFKNVITFHISEEIFEVQQYTGTLRLYWPQLVKIKETPFDYLFYVNEEQAFVVPKKVIASEDIPVLNQIIELIKKDLNQEPIKPDENFKYKSKTKESKTAGFEKQLKEVAIKDESEHKENAETTGNKDPKVVKAGNNNSNNNVNKANQTKRTNNSKRNRASSNKINQNATKQNDTSQSITNQSATKQNDTNQSDTNQSDTNQSDTNKSDAN